jgi:DNA invertase Pin-like site-specific DNA recombinase
MRIALYLRRSTNEILQPESLLIQEERLRKYALLHGHEVVDVFADSASGLSVKGRKDFARLLKTVEAGAFFEAVLVRDVSRWGRFQNIDEGAYWEVSLSLNNVRVIYAEESFEDAPKPYDGLLKAMRRICAAEFSREKSRLVQAAQASSVARGFRVNGEAPYGMRMIVVDRAGRTVRRLKPGERKDRIAGRLKMEPANNRGTRIVRQVFEWFVNEKLTYAQIVARMNNAGEPTPRKKRWALSTVFQILDNAAYGGIARASFKASSNFAEPETIEYRDAWKGIISGEMFAAAEQLRRSRRRPTTPIDESLVAALNAWNLPLLRETTWYAIGGSFPNGQVSRSFVESAVPAVVEELERLVVARFASAVPTERGVLLQNVFELGLRFSFPRVHDGKLTWEFPMSDSNPEDATLCIGLSIPPDIRAVEMFLLRTRRQVRLGKILRPEILTSSFGRRTGVSYEEAVKKIEYFLFSGPRAQRMMLDAVQGLTYANTAAIARDLGWPENAAWGVFDRLRQSGIEMPTLVWHAKRHVKWTCDGCGEAREVTLRGATRSRTGLCGTCLNARRRLPATVILKCRQCGGARPIKRPQRAGYRLSTPEDALCRSCSGTTNINAARKETTRRSTLLSHAYRRMASELVDALRRRIDPRVDSLAGLPRIVSFALPDGSRRYIRLRILSIDVAARLAEGDRRKAALIARLIARRSEFWSPSGDSRAPVVRIDDLIGQVSA